VIFSERIRRIPLSVRRTAVCPLIGMDQDGQRKERGGRALIAASSSLTDESEAGEYYSGVRGATGGDMNRS